MVFCVLLACTLGCAAAICRTDEDVPLLQQTPSFQIAELSAEAFVSPASFVAERSNLLLEAGRHSTSSNNVDKFRTLTKLTKAAMRGGMKGFEMSGMKTVVKSLGEIPLETVAGYGISQEIQSVLNAALPGAGFLFSEVAAEQSVWGVASGFAIGAADVAGFVLGGPVAGNIAANTVIGAELGGKLLWRHEAVKKLVRKQMLEVAKAGTALKAAGDILQHLPRVLHARKALDNASNSFYHLEEVRHVKDVLEDAAERIQPQAAWKSATDKLNGNKDVIRAKAAIKNATDIFNNLDEVQHARLRLKHLSDSILQLPEVHRADLAKVHSAKVKDVLLAVQGLQASFEDWSQPLKEQPQVQAARSELNHTEQVLQRLGHILRTNDVMQQAMVRLGIPVEDSEDASQDAAYTNHRTSEAVFVSDEGLRMSAEDSEDASPGATEKSRGTSEAVFVSNEGLRMSAEDSEDASPGAAEKSRGMSEAVFVSDERLDMSAEDSQNVSPGAAEKPWYEQSSS